MSWLFLTPLVIAFAVTYLFKNCADEPAYFAVSIAAFCLILSLLLAPWQIKALLLVLVILASRRLLASFLPVDDEENTNIKLLYRGVNYEVGHPTVQRNVEGTEAEIAGKYRGQIWRNQKPQNTVTLTPGMKYRGVSINPQQSIISMTEKDRKS
ncbi:hypothetical protein BCD67_20325 [Oscillatoriales cyanobacterium USR001]|nr:hypothetical protein BCD67_20325 [Oscillatoriales cyanobacterium USR001]